MNIFISHSWSYSEHYEKLSEWLFDTRWKVKNQPIQFLDASVPKDNPIHFAPNDSTLQVAIHQRIMGSHVVLIPTGMYTTHSKWIRKEIDGAGLFRKPIVAVELWGSKKSSSVVIQAADEVVGWKKNSVVGAVWRLGSRRGLF
jgi:hypothetical protein